MGLNGHPKAMPFVWSQNTPPPSAQRRRYCMKSGSESHF
jgi:hypothetical protein